MTKTELYLENSMMNTSGTLGFSPDLKSALNFSRFGAFVTNPISWDPRTPARGERFISFPGGFLLHTGYPNPGLKTVIRLHNRRWAHSPVPIIINLLAQDRHTVERMVRHLEGVEGITGVEIGLPPEIDPDSARAMTLAAMGELSVIVRLPFETSHDLLSAISSVGINAVSIAPPRGALPGAGGFLISGRLYGPGLLAQSLARVKNLVQFGIPIIGGGGVYSQEDAQAFLDAGACAVQLDYVLWQGGFWLNLEG